MLNFQKQFDVIQEHRKHLEKLNHTKHFLLKRLQTHKLQLQEKKDQLEVVLKAQSIVQQVAKDTQETLSGKVSELVSSALQTVFPEPYDLIVSFEMKRGKTEACLTLSRDGNEVEAAEGVGGGVLDVVSFALRCVMWMLDGKTRSVMILDEPFRYVSRDLMPRVAQMIQQISERLGIQFILISHENELIEAADKVFKVTIRKGISHVTATRSRVLHGSSGI